MKHAGLFLFLFIVSSFSCSAQQFSQADLTGYWSGTLGDPNPSPPLGTYSYYSLSFNVDAAGNIYGQYQHFMSPLAYLCPEYPPPPGGYPPAFVSGQLVLTDGSTGAATGTIVINNELICTVVTSTFAAGLDTRISRPGLSGTPNRITGTFTDQANLTNMPLDISGGTQFQQYDLTGTWSGTYVWNDGTGTLPAPYPIPTIQFNVDAQGNISGNGFSGMLTVDSTGLVTGSITNVNEGTLTLDASQQIYLQSPGQNGLPYRIITPPPFVGYSIDISGPAAPPPPPTITSSLYAGGYVGAPFSYTITASGASPISFNAANLPPGLSFNGTTISGTPTVIGSTSVTLTATNVNGTASTALTINIGLGTSIITNPPNNQNHGSPAPPSIASPPSIGNTLFAAGDSVSFTVAATDPSGNSLTYTWNFGDGAIVTGGPTISHVYATGGPYLITVTVSNGNTSGTSTPMPVDIADGKVDLGSASPGKNHGKFGFTLSAPSEFPKLGAKSQLVLGSLSSGTKYSNYKLRGKTSDAGQFTFVLEFTSRKPALTKRIIYTYTLTQ
jgi:hypothetical protein